MGRSLDSALSLNHYTCCTVPELFSNISDACCCVIFSPLHSRNRVPGFWGLTDQCSRKVLEIRILNNASKAGQHNAFLVWCPVIYGVKFPRFAVLAFSPPMLIVSLRCVNAISCDFHGFVRILIVSRALLELVNNNAVVSYQITTKEVGVGPSIRRVETVATAT